MTCILFRTEMPCTDLLILRSGPRGPRLEGHAGPMQRFLRTYSSAITSVTTPRPAPSARTGGGAEGRVLSIHPVVMAGPVPAIRGFLSFRATLSVVPWAAQRATVRRRHGTSFVQMRHEVPGLRSITSCSSAPGTTS
jgi:hypothetical protein